MKYLKDIFLVLTWVFGVFFCLAFWIAVGTVFALMFTMPLIMAVELVAKILGVSFILFIFSAVLTYLFNK